MQVLRPVALICPYFEQMFSPVVMVDNVPCSISTEIYVKRIYLKGGMGILSVCVVLAVHVPARQRTLSVKLHYGFERKKHIGEATWYY